MASSTHNAANGICLAGAPIVRAPDGELAARELARYLYLLTGTESELVDRPSERGTIIVLHQQLARTLTGAIETSKTDHDGFAIRTGRRDRSAYVAVVADSARGLNNGVFALLEELGVGFYLGGDTFPDEQTDAVLPADFGLTQRPAFAVRGNLLHDNTLIGITTWGLADYQFHLHQLAKQRCNTLVITYYRDGAPELWDEQAPRSAAPGPLMSTLTHPWHALQPMRTGQFYFGTGDCFDEDIFACPAAQTLDDPIAQRQEAIRVFQEATRYARRLGVDVAAGHRIGLLDEQNRCDTGHQRHGRGSGPCAEPRPAAPTWCQAIGGPGQDLLVQNGRDQHPGVVKISQIIDQGLWKAFLRAVRPFLRAGHRDLLYLYR